MAAIAARWSWKLSDCSIPDEDRFVAASYAPLSFEVSYWREAGPPNHHDDKVDSDQ